MPNFCHQFEEAGSIVWFCGIILACKLVWRALVIEFFWWFWAVFWGDIARVRS